MTQISPLRHAPEPSWTRTERTDALRAALREEFLTSAGWDPHGEVFAPQRDHPLLGLRKCVVVDCTAGVRTANADLCKVCIERLKVSGLAMEEFAQRPCGKKAFGQKPCRVSECERISGFTCGLCATTASGHNHTTRPPPTPPHDQQNSGTIQDQLRFTYKSVARPAIAMFCSYVSDSRYGWVPFCERQFGDVPSQICFEWNTPRHTTDDAVPTRRRAFTKAELQHFFDVIDDFIDEQHQAGSKR